MNLIARVEGARAGGLGRTAALKGRNGKETDREESQMQVDPDAAINAYF